MARNSNLRLLVLAGVAVLLAGTAVTLARRYGGDLRDQRPFDVELRIETDDLEARLDTAEL